MAGRLCDKGRVREDPAACEALRLAGAFREGNAVVTEGFAMPKASIAAVISELERRPQGSS